MPWGHPCPRDNKPCWGRPCRGLQWRAEVTQGCADQLLGSCLGAVPVWMGTVFPVSRSCAVSIQIKASRGGRHLLPHIPLSPTSQPPGYIHARFCCRCLPGDCHTTGACPLRLDRVTQRLALLQLELLPRSPMRSSGHLGSHGSCLMETLQPRCQGSRWKILVNSHLVLENSGTQVLCPPDSVANN